jgi:starch synthase (maltosyl-transferring)
MRNEYLQRGGRSAFRIRLLLAATLSPAYGIYSGFELCENVPVKKGSEEYIDSEKYQIKARNLTRPDSLAGLIGQINTIRRRHPALQSDWSLKFHQTDNTSLICYSKQSESGDDTILVVVNLDPFHMQHGFIQMPLADWGLGPNAAVEVVDLLSNEHYFWRGEWNYVRLDPGLKVAHILQVTRPAAGGVANR